MEPFDRLEVVVEDVKVFSEQCRERALLLVEVGGENLDRRLRVVCPDLSDAGCVVCRATVIEIVAGDAGHHNVAQPQFGNGPRQSDGL